VRDTILLLIVIVLMVRLRSGRLTAGQHGVSSKIKGWATWCDRQLIRFQAKNVQQFQITHKAVSHAGIHAYCTAMRTDGMRVEGPVSMAGRHG